MFAVCSPRIGVRAARDAGEEQQELVLDLPAHLGRERELVDDHAIAGAEADVADPAEGGRVLVLLADRLPAAVDLDRARPVGQLLGRHLPALVGEQRVQQPDGHRGRGAETGARRRDVGERRDLDAAADAGHVHGFADEFVLEVLDPGDDLLRSSS